MTGQKLPKKVIGITGGVGAGKSLVLDYLQKQYGARVIQADLTGHAVQEPGQACYDSIVKQFGTGILRPDGRIDRGKLAAVVFNDAQLLDALNRLVHPAVRERILSEIREEREEGTAPFIVVEAALLLEAHYDSFCDESWYIHADAGVRERRLMQSRGYTGTQVRQRMSCQMEAREFQRRCDRVIENNGTTEQLYEQIDRAIALNT